MALTDDGKGDFFGATPIADIRKEKNLYLYNILKADQDVHDRVYEAVSSDRRINFVAIEMLLRILHAKICAYFSQEEMKEYIDKVNAIFSFFDENQDLMHKRDRKYAIKLCDLYYEEAQQMGRIPKFIGAKPMIFHIDDFEKKLREKKEEKERKKEEESFAETENGEIGISEEAADTYSIESDL